MRVISRRFAGDKPKACAGDKPKLSTGCRCLRVHGQNSGLGGLIMNDERQLIELERIRFSLERMQSSSPGGAVDFGLFIVIVLLGLILWRVW